MIKYIKVINVTLSSGLLTLTLILLMSNSYSQTTYKGYFCSGANEFSPIQYTREYIEEGDTFTTIYKISSSRNGYYLNITATHYKSEKKVVVDIDDVTVRKEFGHISTQEITYEEPSLEMFGYANTLRANGFDEQGRLPNDLALKFVSSKYENVKIIHVQKDGNLDPLKWYILDETN